MSFSRATTSWRSDSTSGRAMPLGTGVTRPTQWLDRLGVSNGTVLIRRGRRPATAAYRCIIARYVSKVHVSSFDVLIARTGHTTNEIMKVLTLASVILLPGTLVAGVMGMNFKVPLFTHPELFCVVIALIVAGAVVTLTVARLRRWI